MKRRNFVKALLGATIIGTMAPFKSFAQGTAIRYHNLKGQTLFNDALDNPNFWETADSYSYQDKEYDIIRLKSIPNGYVTFISGTGRQSFTPKLVADGIFEHQNLIPEYMDSLNTAQYLGRGIDPLSTRPYRDIYFLADIKVFWMSVPLRTIQYELSNGRYLCTIELVTESMVDAETWAKYQEIMSYYRTRAVDDGSWKSVVPMQHIVGYYLVEPEATFGARVTMVTDMAFVKNLSIWADIGGELPLVLRQGMIAGFMGSVNACIAYQENLKSAK